MRILQVITKRQLRGAEIFAYQLSVELVRMGHQVLIVAVQSPVSFPDLGQIECIDLNLLPRDRFTTFAGWKKFSGIIAEWKPDIIQANASETLKFAVISRFLFRWKTALIYRNANKASDFIKTSFSLRWNKWLAGQLDFVISVSENSRLDYVKTFDIPVSKTTTIPIGTTFSDHDAEPRDALSLPFRYYVNIASLVPEKNHAGLLSLYKKYVVNGGNLALVIVGDGKEREPLMQLSNSLGISDKVYFLGYRKDAISILKKAEALLLPSLIEGLPGVILEAMANSIPVIAYDVGGIPEIIRNMETGLLIEKGNEAQLVFWMQRLETEKGLRTTIVDRAFSDCKTHYNIDVIADRFLRQYEAVLLQKK